MNLFTCHKFFTYIDELTILLSPTEKMFPKFRDFCFLISLNLILIAHSQDQPPCSFASLRHSLPELFLSPTSGGSDSSAVNPALRDSLSAFILSPRVFIRTALRLREICPGAHRGPACHAYQISRASRVLSRTRVCDESILLPSTYSRTAGTFFSGFFGRINYDAARTSLKKSVWTRKE